ncbi:hypothetical protein J1G35_26760 [Pseudomonas sp. SH10-3B]|uniref:hypothetical protein n=1 Tax=Pseudomonas sp. SH10-3B TaxID=2816049 RepID=UPI001CA76F9C|nr:hypothetical protein [Pseudomonas sp. SH10-3B]MBY8949468.1 hypothetical protein [Pseudomonas sp. SH10-3B]
MIISDALLDRVNEDPISVCLEVCQLASHHANKLDSDAQLEVCLFLAAVIDGGLLDYQGDIPRPEDGKIHRVTSNNFVATVQSQIEAIVKRESAISFQREAENRFKQIIKSGFGYDFSEADVNRVQTLINELRTLLTADSSLDDDHKRRLLNRLEALQKELHKRVSDLSNFYHLIGDAGVAVGKLGKDAKPFVDRIAEILQIGWKAQARAEKLPSSADNPMIGHDGEVPKLE